MAKWWKNQNGSLIDLEKFVEIWCTPDTIHGSTQYSETWEIEEAKDKKQLEEIYGQIQHFMRMEGVYFDKYIDHERSADLELIKFLYYLDHHLKDFINIAYVNIKPNMIKDDFCRKIFNIFLMNKDRKPSLSSLEILENLQDDDWEDWHLLLQEIDCPFYTLSEYEKLKKFFEEAILRILERNFFETKEKIREKISMGQYSESEGMKLAEQFSNLKSPKIKKS
jgi:hypothetical protein